MSQNTKVAVAIAVVVVLGVAAYYWYAKMMPQEDTTFTTASSTLPSGNSTTDTSLNEDTAAIDAELKGLIADQATVNSSVDDSEKTY
ncbi:MAG: hypothetical protein AB203_02470 [Parcubacteria bacterium C7867-008]|nr:MAG: hypothetical protein AB203_02470 [Parcubacteria bacterium C7867-008]